MKSQIGEDEVIQRLVTELSTPQRMAEQRRDVDVTGEQEQDLGRKKYKKYLEPQTEDV